jgi:hypothetical protein
MAGIPGVRHICRKLSPEAMRAQMRPANAFEYFVGRPTFLLGLLVDLLIGAITLSPLCG